MGPWNQILDGVQIPQGRDTVDGGHVQAHSNVPTA